MANPIAEAFVQVRPDMTVFGPQVQAGISRALAGLQLPTTVQNRVATQMFGRNWQQQVQSQTTGALQNTNVPTTTQRSLAQKLFGPGFRNEAGRAVQGTLVGLGGGQLAAQFAFFGPGGAALAVVGAGLAAATASAIDFEQQLEILRATTQATEDDLRRAADAAEELGQRADLPDVTATGAAQAITELAKAGLSLDDAIAGAEGTLRLATAASIDAGTAAQIAAAGLNAFSLAGDEAAHVADLLAGASIAAQGDIGDMALALQQSSAVAAQAGLSIEQLVGLITALARQGILGSDAGTSIRTMLLRLVPTTKEAAAEMESLGVQLDQTRTIGEQLPEVIEQYRRGLALLTPIQRQAALQQIFGTDAVRSATVAFAQGAVGIDAATDAANRQGAAQELAEARTRGAAGALRDLRNEAESAALGLGQELSPAVEAVAGDLATAIRGVRDFASAVADLNADLSEQVGLPSFRDAASVSGLDLIRSGLDSLGIEIGEASDEAAGAKGIFDLMLDGIQDDLTNTITGLQTIPQLLRLASNIGIDASELQSIFETVQDDGEDAGFQLGRRLMDGVAGGITQSEARAIAAARTTLDNIRREGERQVIEAIRSARANVESLADSLVDSLGEIIDLGPIGDRIRELNEELDALEERTSRRTLRFDLGQAERDLREARDAIVQVGVLTPAQRRAQNEFLDPFREKVQSAKDDIKRFDLTEAIEQQEELRDAAELAAEEGIQKLVDDFEEGRISAGEFTTMLRRQLEPALDTIRRENLGLSFERGFLRDVETLVGQVKALAPFIGTPGTTPGPQVINPATTQADVNRQIAQAQLALSQAIQDANALDKQDLAKQDRQIALLRRIVDLLGGPTKRPNTIRGGD